MPAAIHRRGQGRQQRHPRLVQALFCEDGKAAVDAAGGRLFGGDQLLERLKATGTDDADKVMAYLKKTRVSDMFARNAEIRPDGRLVHDMYLMQVKAPAESKVAWDYYRVVATIPGDQAYTTEAETKCAAWK
jgi:hypothetical protein